MQARFLSYAYRSLKEVVTCLELCQRLYPALPTHPVESLIDEGNQLSRMTHSFMKRLDAGPRTPPDGKPHNSQLETHY
jgi:four helix bundle protein